MDGKIPSSRKRPYLEELEEFDDASKPPKQKKVRFPKGRKVKPGEEEKIDITKILEEEAAEGKEVTVGGDVKNPRLAAKERAKRRNLITAELFSEELNDVSTAEVTYQDNENFVEDGIQIEPFNLDQEREEGYFDAQGNFIEYVSEREIKDAWLDSVAVDPRYAGKNSEVSTEDDTRTEVTELSSADIGLIKKRIASVLEPGETVLQALRRLRGNSNNRKQKMSAETQLLFDQLTEDANKLLEQGEYDVYHDKQEVFKRESEGYEKLVLARGNLTSLSVGMEKDMLFDVADQEASSSKLSNSDAGTSNTNVSIAETSGNGADEYDMFADDDDDNGIARPSSNSGDLASGSISNGVAQPSSSGQSFVSETGTLQDDYVYDDTSGYYYSSSSGYYYDPSTGLYCYATTGQWFSYNEETGTYEAVLEAAPDAN